MFFMVLQNDSGLGRRKVSQQESAPETDQQIHVQDSCRITCSRPADMLAVTMLVHVLDFILLVSTVLEKLS